MTTIYPKTQKYTELIVDKISNEPKKTQSHIGQTVLRQRTIFEEAEKLMGEAIEDKYNRIELKDKTIII